MKTALRTEKFTWLQQHGYSILAAEDGSGWTATSRHTGLQVHFTNNAMTVYNAVGSKVEGWMELSILNFKLLTVSLSIVQPNPEERNELQAILNENYALDFLNELS